MILKLIRYEPGEHIESLPHCDKSAFTVHMHSDDEASDQFVIGRWQPTELLLTDLAPIARPDSARSNDAVVFPGMFLVKWDIQKFCRHRMLHLVAQQFGIGTLPLDYG